MRRYVIRRLIGIIPVMLGVIFVTMLTTELIPGDPVALMLGENARPEQEAALRKHLGLDQPLPVRYARYVLNVATGDLGRSIQTNRPVLDEIRDVWPNTLVLAVAAMALAIVVGVTVGVISAVRPYGIIDSLARVLALIGLSMPIFWLGLVMLYVFAYYFRLFPVGGTGSWKHYILPAIALATPSIGILSRMTRSSLLDVMGEDFIRTARAKGLRGASIITRHALRNAMIPVMSVVGLQFGQLLGGAVLTETIFSWPGLGRLTVRGVFARDFVLVQGAVLTFAMAFVLINLLIDLSYAYIDPRIHYD
ncbi:MAG TPA: ABC transporter permease [Thermomicrobiales bacterium]|nr:ABC transporter permease [Thermomicrobiales bacterium]